MNRMLRMHDVLAATGLSRSTIYQKMEKGEFPRGVKLGARGGVAAVRRRALAAGTDRRRAPGGVMGRRPCRCRGSAPAVTAPAGATGETRREQQRA
jgi:hypothetical protein